MRGEEAQGGAFRWRDFCTCRGLATRENKTVKQNEKKERLVRLVQEPLKGRQVRGRAMSPEVSYIMLQTLGFPLGDKGNRERDSSKLVT